ncbi:hypothetical protein LCGC14_2144070, partial [marine sediment metagenome]
NKLNPFAGGQQGFIRREGEQLFGGIGLSQSVKNEFSRKQLIALKAEIMFRGVGQFAALSTITNYSMCGHGPWQNEKGRRGDICMGTIHTGTDKERFLYIPMTSLMPELSRALNITALRALVENYGDPKKVLTDAGRRLINTPVTYGIGAPGIGTATTSLLGRAPFFTENLELLKVVPPSADVTKTVARQQIEAIGQMNPTLEKLFGFGPSEKIPLGIRAINAITPGMKAGRLTSELPGHRDRADAGSMFQIVRSAVAQAQNKHPGDFSSRLVLYERAAGDFATEEEQQNALTSMIQFDQRRSKSILRSGAGKQ